VVAYVPPQTGHDGIVSIVVVEGKLSAIAVKGASASPTRHQGQSASLADRRHPASACDRRPASHRQQPAKQVQVLLKPGQQSGQSRPTGSSGTAAAAYTVGLDSTGNDRTGNYRASLGWQHASITGHDDVLGAQLQVSPTELQQVAVLSLGYRWPLYAQRMAIDAFFAYSDVDGGTTASTVGDLRFVGRGRVIGARAGWYLPRWGDFDTRLTLGLDHRAYLNRCDIAGLPSGACGPAGESVAVTPLSLEYSLRSGGATPTALSVSLHHNLHLGGSHTSTASFDAVRRHKPATAPVGLSAMPIADTCSCVAG
jgi:hemolysin activation/secretion protein